MRLYILYSIFLLGILCSIPRIAWATEFFVSPSGSDTADGAIDRPFKTIQKAVELVKAGDIIYLRGGTHKPTPHPKETYAGLLIDKQGTAESPIYLKPYAKEQVIIDGSLAPDTDGVIVLSSAKYWIIENLIIENSSSPTKSATHGILLYGSSDNNILRRLKVRKIDGVGIRIADRGTQNLIEQCESYQNYDITGNGGNADGFQIIGNGENTIQYSLAWQNGDDGFDLWTAGATTITHSYAYENGYDVPHQLHGTDPNAKSGDGVGFKLGGGVGAFSDPHIIRFNIAFKNKYTVFDYNTRAAPLIVENNTSVSNEYGFIMGEQTDEHTVRNNLSYLSRKGEIIPEKIGTDSFNSWNLDITNPLFVSMDIADPQFLHLSEGSPARDVGIDIGLSGDDTKPDLGAIPFAAIPNPTLITTPTGVPTATPIIGDCIQKWVGDADCKQDINKKSVSIFDYAIWYSEYINGCSAEFMNRCGADEDKDGNAMDANFNFPGTNYILTDTKVDVFDYAVWIQGYIAL